jgi:single-stranded-DNA-specific exonuclease
MLRTWLEPDEIDVPDAYIQAIGGNRMVSQVLYTRGLHDIDKARGFLSPQYYHPTPPAELPGLINAVELLQEALKTRKVIGVWGDFDVDGQTSTTVLVSALRSLSGNVIYHIPVRAEESHGINLAALQKFMAQKVDLIISCDTGISSHQAIDYANQQGVAVIITDHHDLPKTLPQAQALVNPKLLPAGHPLAYLPGVGVAYKVVEELFSRTAPELAAQQFLDLVALGIVADIALLRDENRYLCQNGLQALRRTKRTGLLAIMELAELNQANLTEEHIGYILAPRMNALGRLYDANSIVELLTTTDHARAQLLALELEGMNAQRKLLSDQVYQAAKAQIEADPQLLEFPVLVLSQPTWPAGVIGIVASRLVEQYHRPTILLATPPGQAAHGSARSIEGINVTSAIADNRELVMDFGGHPMAAGLSMDPHLIPNFRQAISRTVHDMGVEVQAEKELHVDGYLSLPELSLDLVEDLERMAPFGAGNPPLVFASRNLRLIGYAAVGRSGEHLQLTIEDELGYSRHSIWWQGAGYVLPEGKFDLAYSVRASTYRGQRDVQLEWIDYRQEESQPISLIAEKRLVEIVDLRKEPQPLKMLHQIGNQDNLVIWAESTTKPLLTSVDRNALYPSNTLVVWTIPPGLNELHATIRLVDPIRVYLFGIDPGMDRPEEFLKRLSGLVKNRLKSHDGLANLPALAAATSQKAATVKLGLQWLEAKGHIKVLYSNGDEAKLVAGTGVRSPHLPTISEHLDAQLAESAAFRRYYLAAGKEKLLALEEEAKNYVERSF